MTKLKLTIVEGLLLVARTKAAERGEGRLLDIIMPNGKPLGECTGDYIRQVGDAMIELGMYRPAPADPETSR